MNRTSCPIDSVGVRPLPHPSSRHPHGHGHGVLGGLGGGINVGITSNVAPSPPSALRRASSSLLGGRVGLPSLDQDRHQLAMAQAPARLTALSMCAPPTMSPSGVGGGVGGGEGAAAAAGASKPTRPLSAYNLFFRYERAQLLLESEKESNDADGNGESNRSDGNDTGEGGDGEKPDPSGALRKRRDSTKPPPIEDVRYILKNNPFHVDNKNRVHSRTHGKIGFLDLVKHISSRWKAADKETKEIFKKLATEDRDRYKRENMVYNMKLNRRVTDCGDSSSSLDPACPSSMHRLHHPYSGGAFQHHHHQQTGYPGLVKPQIPGANYFPDDDLKGKLKTTMSSPVTFRGMFGTSAGGVRDPLCAGHPDPSVERNSIPRENNSGYDNVAPRSQSPDVCSSGIAPLDFRRPEAGDLEGQKNHPSQRKRSNGGEPIEDSPAQKKRKLDVDLLDFLTSLDWSKVE